MKTTETSKTKNVEREKDGVRATRPRGPNKPFARQCGLCAFCSYDSSEWDQYCWLHCKAVFIAHEACPNWLPSREIACNPCIDLDSPGCCGMCVDQSGVLTHAIAWCRDCNIQREVTDWEGLQKSYMRCFVEKHMDHDFSIITGAREKG